MSQENVEVVLDGYRAFAREDPDAVFAVLHPAIVWETLDAVPDPAINEGHEGIAKLWAGWADAFDDFWVRPGPLVVEGEHKVFVNHRTGGRLKETAQDAREVTFDNWTVYTLRDSLVVHINEYVTLQEALEAADIDEPTVYTLQGTEVVAAQEYRTRQEALEAVGASE